MTRQKKTSCESLDKFQIVKKLLSKKLCDELKDFIQTSI